MELLPTEARDIYEVISDSNAGFSRVQFSINTQNPWVFVRYRPDTTGQRRFLLTGGPGAYVIKLEPGPDSTSDTESASSWGEVLTFLTTWLGYLRKDLDGIENARVPVPPSKGPSDLLDTAH